MAAALAQNGTQSVAYYTRDGGNSWRRSLHGTPAADVFPGGDPVTTWDDAGTAYLATITPFRIWRSSDGGVSWQGPSLIPGRSFDREYLAVRPTPGAIDTLYALAKTPIRIFGHLASDVLALARSLDGGRTFEAPRLLLPDPTRSITHVAGGIVAVPDGAILISYMAHDVPLTDPATIRNHIWVVRSGDGGRTFDDPVAAAASVVRGNAGDELDMLKSLAIAPMVMDTSRHSPFRGRLYVAYLTLLAGRLQVMVTASSDTGRSWGSSVTVNDDMGRANHSTPQVAVNDRGVVAVTWNDRRADVSDLCFRATVSASVDGGSTFLPSVPLDTTLTCPLGAAGRPSPERRGFTWRYVQGGETQGLAALADGKFLAVYIGGAETMQLRSTTIEVRDRR